MKKRILVADDHAVLRQTIAGFLESEFIVCSQCSNGKEAVERTVALRPDVVVLDVNMPRLNGIEATQMIRRFVPSAKVLLMSLHHPSQLAAEAEVAGADGFFSKTSPPQELLRSIEQLTRAKHAEPALA